MADFNLGTVTAYGYAKSKGYTGTEEEFAALMASYASVAEEAAESAEEAAASAQTATTKAGEASASATAAATAKTAAQTAQSGAETAAQTATTQAGNASDSATTASAKATEAAGSAATASTKATEAATSATNAAGSATTASTKAGEAAASATAAEEAAEAAEEAAQTLVIDTTLTQAGQAADAKATGDELSALKVTMNAFPTDTASGAIASLPDGADNVPVKSLIVNIEPVQDLHGQDAPYPVGGGVNKLPPMVDGTYTGNGVTAVVKDGIATLSGTTTAAGNALIIPLADTVTVPDAYMHLMNSVTNGSVEPSFENSADVGGTSAIFSCSPANRITQISSSKVGKTWNRIRFYLGSGVTLSGTFAPMIIADSTARSAYIPYSNICPISGHTSAVVTRTGKNLFDFKSDYSDWSDGYLRGDNGLPSGTAAVAPAYERTTPFIPIKGGLPFTFSFTNISSATISNNMCFYDADKNFVGTRIVDGAHFYITGTAPDNAAYVRVSARTFNGMSNVQLEVGSTATAYEPYNGQQYTIDLDGTRYGGTLNVETGVLTVDRAYIANPTFVSVASTATLTYTQLTLTGAGTTSGFVADIVTSLFKATTSTVAYTCKRNGNQLFIYLPLGTTLEQVNQMAENLQVVYPIATPTTVQLTAQEISTLLGQNNIWSDAGDVEVEYRADTKLYIEKLTAPTEDDMIADHAISANSFFMVGNTLYRATTAIASGATITVGTNATKLSLSDALNALA